ncbi:MAG: NAD(P)H-binding protein [Ideonella sp.]|nr:NAD(P)H-binding protein [Ideonella sp.]MBL0149493.1 NAD(P)H-binding protein [Ideonella sp.]
MTDRPQFLRYALAGASGLVGRALAQQLAADRDCGELHLLLRRPLPALEALPQAHAVAWRSCAMPELPRVDIALCALGTTMATAGSQAAFRAVDYDAVLAFAQAARRAGAKRFGLVSALGADAASAIFYNRTKGEAEQAVAQLGFKHLVIARPSLLLGDRSALGQATRPTEALAQWFAPALAWFTPRRLMPIRAEVVARGLLTALETETSGVHVVECDELHRLGG